VAKRRKPPRLVPSERRAPPDAAATPAARPRIDVWELVTGVFVLVASLLPGSPWFEYAADIVVTTVIFEFGMAWLGICASGAEAKASRAFRIALVMLGVLLVALAGIHHAIQLDAPGAIVPGLWILASRLRRPAGASAFDPQHCRTIAFEAIAAWCTLLGILALMILFQALSRGSGPVDLSHGGLFAVAWGGFYGTLAFLMPWARRKAMRKRR
jgi:hypothetical protein